MEELSDKRPIIMGKEAIIRDSITYMTYVAGKLMRGALVSTYDSYCNPSLLAGYGDMQGKKQLDYLQHCNSQ